MKKRGQLSLDLMVGMTMVLLFVGAAVAHLGNLYKVEQRDAAVSELQLFATTLSKSIDNIYSYGANFQETITLNFKYLTSVNVVVSNGQVKVTSTINGAQYTASAPIHAEVKPATLSLSKGGKLQLETVQERGGVYVEVEKLS